MVATIDTLWRSPLKGAQGRFQQYLLVDDVDGVQDDRQYAIRRKPGGDLEKWAPKAAFYVAMNTPQMAIERPVFWSAHNSHRKLSPVYLEGLAQRLGATEELVVQRAGESFSLHDTKGAFVSFINLASVEALEDFTGWQIDPRRFRMNVWMAGLEPFEELDWVDTYPGTRILEVGDCRFRVDDACERCKAPEANPETGQFDLQIQTALDTMMSKRGYKSPHRGVPRVMGILAAPLDEGIIKIGDTIRLV